MTDSGIPFRVMHTCLSTSWGGLEMYPGRVAPELQHQGWQVHGLALKGSRVAQSFQQVDVPALTFTSPGAALLRVRQVLAYLKHHDIRVLHCHKSGDMRLGGLLAALWPELRLFFTDHMGVKKPKKDLYHRWVYGKTRRVFSISQATYRTNLAALPVPAGRLQQLYYGIDLSMYSPPLDSQARREVRESLGVTDDEIPVLALPGRISESKGHGLWVEALAVLKHAHPQRPWHAVIVGEAGGKDAEPDGFEDRLRARIGELELNDRLAFTGFRHDLARCLMAVDLVCIPSHNEAFGLAVIEAMAAGAPVIGSDAGAIPELLDSGRGLAVPPDVPAAWADAMAELLDSPASRHSMAEAGQRWVTASFDLSKHVEKLTAAYQLAG